ncbi:MAG: STAS/SEC14 domain-containing protein [Gaiellales bacterium]
MIEKLDRSAGSVLGVKCVGSITKDDYGILVPAVESVVDEHGSVRLLIDVSEFRWEKIGAWWSDLSFGRTYRKKIERLAIVGDRSWGKALAKVSAPLFAREAQHFVDAEAAWAWLEADAGA